MEQAKLGMKDFVLTLTAGVEQLVDWRGNAFHIFEADTDVTLNFNESGERIKRKAGQGGNATREYDRVIITSAVDQQIRISLGYGGVNDNTAQVTGNVTASWAASNNSKVTGDVVIPPETAAQVIGANVNRQSLAIMSNEDNLSSVRLGTDNTVNGSSGLPIQIGATASMNAKNAFWVYNPHTTESVTIHVLETEII
ncbi:hypothetical protein ACFOEK_12230 [Litoribrevibacter euphylliae]|uniref:Uncharacterized protein n=1 Tax=Litoribrevibacter euphylliae TaxID=1834034 RepID=A0ABV7HGP4_9GAMM